MQIEDKNVYLPYNRLIYGTAQAMLETRRFIDELSEDQMDFIDSLEPLNIEARYPSYKEQLMKVLTSEYCKELLEKTKALQLWIKDRL